MDIKNLPSPSEFKHHCRIQLRFNDVDILGHVNNTVYFSFYDTGKAHYFEATRTDDMDWQRVDTVIANVNCAYISPVIFGENIEVLTRCVAIYDKSFVLEQMLVDMDKNEIKSVCETVMVGYDPFTKSTIRISDKWRKEICRYEGCDLNKQKQ